MSRARWPRPPQERLFDQSDAYRVHVCEQCGLIAVANLKKNQFHCTACQTSTGIVQASRVMGGVGEHVICGWLVQESVAL
jgi:hypothetical protein